MLKITNLDVSIENISVLKNISLEIPFGQMHALTGRNGSGKSTLVHTIAGTPYCEVINGIIKFNEQDLALLKIHERARAGIFCAFQNPPVIPGLSVWHYLKEAYAVLTHESLNSKELHDKVVSLLSYLSLDQSFLERGLYEGFSGGEKKRFELLQIMLFKPLCILFDEIDSGLDMQGRELVVKVINSYKKENPNAAMLIISHYQELLRKLALDHMYYMEQGILTTTDRDITQQTDTHELSS